MKTILLPIILALSALITPLKAQTVTLNFTLGELRDAQGITLEDGALLQVISLSSGTLFEAPGPDSFLGDREILLWSGAFDSTTTGVPGAMLFSVNLTVQEEHGTGALPHEFAPLIVRWYPTLDAATSPAVPGEVAYGEYGAGLWSLPASGNLADYTFLSESLGGSDPDSLGIASQQVTAVPEPGALALMTMTLIAGWIGMHRAKHL